MFGHDNKDENKEEHDTGGSGPVVQPLSTTPPDENLVGVGPAASASPAPANDSTDDDDISKIVDDINASTDAEEKPETPAAPEVKPEPSPEPEEPDEPVVEAATEDSHADEPTLSETPAELLEVKKSALQELSPLLDELDQPADEKLNILMMTIQATDDQALLPQALETAKKIDDKKARAEAMLDIIQEINYFTKKQ